MLLLDICRININGVKLEGCFQSLLVYVRCAMIIIRVSAVNVGENNT